VAGAIVLLLCGVARPATAQPIDSLTTTNGMLRAKATPDECFLGVAINFPFTKPPCGFGTPKVNQAYVWAMTKAPGTIWFGTTANPQCLTQGGLASDPTQLRPYRTTSAACEFGSSPYVPWLLPAAIGDFRPPQMFVYDTTTHELRDVTPKVPASRTNPLGFDPRVAATRGIRAAATVGNLVMMVGPSLLGGLNFFFFQADTQEFLGFGNLPGYDNIRQFLNVDGDLYAAVGQTRVGGAVLKWTGSFDADACSTCLAFDVVGTLDGIGAYIASHQGRLFVTTWPSGLPESVAGLYRSPRVPDGGLTVDHASRWTKVWSATDYEPDRAVAASYAGGALASFDGQLYWGTMHVPWNATAVFIGVYGAPTTDQAWSDAVVGTFRTAAIFRGRDFSRRHRRHIDLLYGSAELPVYRPPVDDQPGRWEQVSNNMPPGHRAPLYGLSGFNNAYNNYTWSMAVWNHRLWVGTMDWSHTAEQGTEQVFEAALQPIPFNIEAFFSVQNFGGDLFFFQDSRTPAVAESTGGAGNPTSYGIRNMVATAKSLFLGMANAANLLTGSVGPRGGWELIELSPRATRRINLLTRFSCSRILHDDDKGDDEDDHDIDEDDNSTTTTSICVVRTMQEAPAEGLTVGVVNLSPDVAFDVPLTVTIPAGKRYARFKVVVPDITTTTTTTTTTEVLLIAGLNGGTRVTSIDRSSVDDGCERR
jgi:hypothetical protein